jgi:hypothetical protein
MHAYTDSIASLLSRIRLDQYIPFLEANHVDESNMQYLDMHALESFGIGVCNVCCMYYVCVYVHVLYACVYVCMYESMYACMYICIHVCNMWVRGCWSIFVHLDVQFKSTHIRHVQFKSAHIRYVQFQSTHIRYFHIRHIRKFEIHTQYLRACVQICILTHHYPQNHGVIVWRFGVQFRSAEKVRYVYVSVCMYVLCACYVCIFWDAACDFVVPMQYTRTYLYACSHLYVHRTGA